MVKLFVLCFLLGNIAVDLAMASDNKTEAMVVERCSSASCSNPSTTEAPSVLLTRKLGPPSMAPESDNSGVEEKKHSHAKHSSTDKSIAGGGVILGGLATTFLVSVFCYIKATARSHHNNEDSPSSSP
ncbi:hypothetical protein K1719_038413 [Acacia pycnantha]|nr:hypothetical protein K1719_038413 [Acacia pycnantha]